MTGFLGPNGAGKTTTLGLIADLGTPTSGKALVSDQPYTSLVRPLYQAGVLLDATAVHLDVPHGSMRCPSREATG